MKAAVPHRPHRRFGWLLVMALWTLWAPAWAQDVLTRWRTDVAAARLLADNNAPQALNEARLLLRRLPQSAPFEDRVRGLNLLARAEAYMAYTELSLQHAAQAIETAQALGLQEAQAEALLTNILNHINQGDIARATEATEQAFALLDGSRNTVLQAEAMLRAAGMYLRKGQVDEAINLSLRLLDVARHSQNALALTYAYQGLASVYGQSNREAEAMDYYARMHTAALTADSGMLAAHGVLGRASLLLAQKDLAEAERLARDAVARFRKVGMPFYLAHSLYGLADVLRAKQDTAGALQALNEVAAIYQRYPNKLGLWWLLFARSQDYQTLGLLPQALTDARRCRDIADEVGLVFYITECTRRLSHLEAASGHPQVAYDLMVLAQTYAKQQEKERIGTRLTDLSQRFQQESRQREIARLTQQAEVQATRQQALLALLGMAALLLGLSGYYLKKLGRTHRRTEALNTELDRSRLRLQAMLNALPDLVFEVDADGRYLSCHTREHALLVAPVSDFLGSTINEILPPHAAEVGMRALRQAQQEGLSTGMQYTLQLPRGLCWFDLFVARIEPGAEAGDERFMVLVRDITDQEHARQLMLRQIELDRRLSHFAELAPGFMFSYQQSRAEARGVFLYASHGAEEVCGVTVAQLLDDPRAFVSTVATGHLQALVDTMLQAARACEPYQVEYLIQHPVKGACWLELRAAPEKDSGGAVLWHGHVMDISARKAAESRLQASEQAFRTLAENFPDPIARFDLQGRLMYANPKVLKLMAQPESEVLGRRPSELNLVCTPMHTERVEQEALQVLRTGEASEFLAEWVTPLGERIFEIRHIPEKDQAGQLVSVMSVGRNITRQKLAELALKQSRDELRRLSAHLNDVREQERKRIAREIHDELGQMLTALKLDLGTLRLQFGAINPVLDQRTQRLILVVEDTIQVVRTIATALRPSSLDMGLVPAVEWLVAEFRKRSEVTCELHVHTVDAPLADEQSTALFRFLQEALTNVTRHAQAQRVDIVLDGDAQALVLRVTDDGVGFDVERHKAHSFGLVGIQERALILGGVAQCRSAPGEGTMIEIRIPRSLNERQHP